MLLNNNAFYESFQRNMQSRHDKEFLRDIDKLTGEVKKICSEKNNTDRENVKHVMAFIGLLP
jgi:hypothetical protein